jgi:peroxiredoxin
MSIWQPKDKVKVGSVAPNFTLPSQSGEIESLEDFLGDKSVVLFFYPKDDSPGCTKQVCAFSGTITNNSGSSMPRSLV